MPTWGSSRGWRRFWGQLLLRLSHHLQQRHQRQQLRPQQSSRRRLSDCSLTPPSFVFCAVRWPTVPRRSWPQRLPTPKRLLMAVVIIQRPTALLWRPYRPSLPSRRAPSAASRRPSPLATSRRSSPHLMHCTPMPSELQLFLLPPLPPLRPQLPPRRWPPSLLSPIRWSEPLL